MKPAAKLLDRVRRGVQSVAYGNALYQKFLEAGETPGLLRFTPPDIWPGDAKLGLSLIAEQAHLFDNPSVAAFRDLPAAIRGLRAAGTDAARHMTLRLMGHWLRLYGNWHEVEWAPGPLGERIASWIGFYEFYAPAASETFIENLSASLSRQWRHLMRTLPASAGGLEGLCAIKGLVYGGFNFPEGEKALGLACDLLARQLRAEILNDGMHISRNPSLQLHALRHLLDLRAALAAAGITAPAELQTAISAMVPALRFFLCGDGGLALFHGGFEESPLLVEAVLAQSGVKNRALRRLSASGYERLQAGRSLLIADAGPPPPRGYDEAAHAATSAFEFGQGRERIVVNCGALPVGGPEWRLALASTAAHSALAVEDTNICDVRMEGLGSAPQVEVQRYEERDVHCVDVTHDGYRSRFGLLHRRRLRLAKDGDELQCREMLSGSPGRTFTLRWHLHPAVQVSLAQGGQAALLRTASGAGWRLRVEGASLGLEGSIYCGAGEPRKSLQLKAQGRTQQGETEIVWSLAREKKEKQ